MKQNNHDNGLKEKIISACNIPKDAALGYPITKIVGDKELIIENYRGILEYNNELIKVVTKIGQIKIMGVNLEIEYYTNDEMKIVGKIEKIHIL